VPQCGSKLEALTSHRSSTQLFCSFNSASENAFFNVFDRLWLITALFYLPSFAEAISDLELHQRGLCLNVARSWKL